MKGWLYTAQSPIVISLKVRNVYNQSFSYVRQVHNYTKFVLNLSS